MCDADTTGVELVFLSDKMGLAGSVPVRASGWCWWGLEREELAVEGREREEREADTMRDVR